MRAPLIMLKLDKYDYGLILNALNDKRNQLIQEKEDTEIYDNVLLKLIDAFEKTKGIGHYER